MIHAVLQAGSPHVEMLMVEIRAPVTGTVTNAGTAAH